jgi:PKD repeat protein
MKEMNITSTEDFSISGNTISVVLDALGDTSEVELWGYAVEYTETGDVTSEWWGDWVPNEEFPYYGQTSENEPPVAAFTYTPTNPGINQTINFDASSSSDTDGSITKYEWDWNNDGIYDDTQTTPTATHSWTQVGSYPVKLQVTDNNGTTNTKTQTISVGSEPGTTEPKTPGFELILVLCAVVVSVMLWKKKRNT